MSIPGVHWEFSIPEIKYLLFGKKQCPVCGASLIRKKNEEIVTGKDVNHPNDPMFFPSAKVRHFSYTFVCESCKREFCLNELI